MERAGHVRRVCTNDHASTVHLPNTEQAENARDFLDLPSILKEIIKLGCSSRWVGFTDRLRKQRQCGSEVAAGAPLLTVVTAILLPRSVTRPMHFSISGARSIATGIDQLDRRQRYG